MDRPYAGLRTFAYIGDDQLSSPLEHMQGRGSEWKPGRFQETEEEISVVADPLDAELRGLDWPIEGLGAEVRQLAALEVCPQLLDGVELRGVGGQALEDEPVPLGYDVAGHLLAAMGRQPG